jgi:hypothetical protein
MNEGSKMRSAAVGARARAAMAAGARLDDVLRTFRTHDNLGAIGSILALREIMPIPLWCSKILVTSGRSYAHLTLADLEMLRNAPPDGVNHFIHFVCNDAIIERKPYLLLARDHPRPPMWTSAIPLETSPTNSGGSTYGPFDMRASAAIPAGPPPCGRPSCASCVTSPTSSCCTSFARHWRHELKHSKGMSGQPHSATKRGPIV